MCLTVNPLIDIKNIITESNNIILNLMLNHMYMIKCRRIKIELYQLMV